jgi:hypothetical protein
VRAERFGSFDGYVWVSTTGTDADYVVKLIDVCPAAPRREARLTLNSALAFDYAGSDRR